jgi:2-polyprenyl-6-methoxyphenol hydroxylase-like FAD-dependent oxidoreductase
MSGRCTQAVDVLIVGGGLVGLTAALLLRAHGVTVTLAEKQASASPQPKARRLHMRSMEIYRQLGLARLVHDAARDLAGHDHMAIGRTLAQAEQLPLWQAGSAGSAEVPSPEPPCLLSQDLLEPLLREAAVRAGADVCFDTELLSFTQSDDRVDAQLRSGRKGDLTRISARYLIAADGARSPVREFLGITRSGNGFTGKPSVSVYFTADLAEVVRGREFNLCQITHEAVPGALASVDGRRRWVFMSSGGDLERDWPALLRSALGVPAPDLEVLSVLAWRPEMRVARRYRAGRVFLAGDAAHVMPPFAASGANTGIADAHNLAWKLANVLEGQAGAGLLDSYDAERRPAGWFAADESARRSQQLRDRSAPDPGLAHPYVLAAGGFQYTAGALIASPLDLDDPEPTTRFEPCGRVGTRVPHRWLDPEHTRSTIDLAGPGWALLTRSEPPAVPVPAGLPGVAVHRTGAADFLGEDELVLLRPDHIVAWRGTDPGAALTALRAILRP